MTGPDNLLYQFSFNFTSVKINLLQFCNRKSYGDLLYNKVNILSSSELYTEKFTMKDLQW